MNRHVLDNSCSYENDEICDGICNYVVFGGGLNAFITALSIQEKVSTAANVLVVIDGPLHPETPPLFDISYPVADFQNNNKFRRAIKIAYTNTDNTNLNNIALNIKTKQSIITPNVTTAKFEPNGGLAETYGATSTLFFGSWKYFINHGNAVPRDFINALTSNVALSDAENLILSRAEKTLKVQSTSSAIVNFPAGLNHNKLWIKEHDTPKNTRITRELGTSWLNEFTSKPNTNIISNLYSITVKASDDDSYSSGTTELFDCSFNGKEYKRCKLIFRFTIPTEVRYRALLGIESTNPTTLNASYRAVIPIPTSGAGFENTPFYLKLMSCFKSNCCNSCSTNNCYNCYNSCSSSCTSNYSSNCASSCSSRISSSDNSSDSCCCSCSESDDSCGRSILCSLPNFTSGIDLSNTETRPDLITTLNTFTISNPCNYTGEQATPTWNLAVSVTPADLNSPDPLFNIAGAGTQALIIDAESLQNSRILGFNPDSDAIEVSYNDYCQEYDFAYQFATIVSAIVYIFTAVKICPKAFLQQCLYPTTYGLSQDRMVVDMRPNLPSNLAIASFLIEQVFGR